ncbi:MAG: hypothetical protein O3B13_12160 [Planctomycetota bacterium]|nr:hypothetical protein [Planctomycetota bacterium]MDA1163849.1 hypothetical protein [Planctomycetota bacterium]
MKTDCRHNSLPGMLALVMASAMFIASAATESLAQPGNQQEQVTITKGTVAEVIRKGRATSLVILSEAGGEPVTVPITPRLQFAVEAKGDSAFLAEKQVVSGTGTLTNKSLFVKNWTVYVGLAAKKIRPFAKQAGKAIGQSQNSYEIAGTVTSRQQDKDYPEYETLGTNIRELQNQPVYIDKGATVTVSMTETDLVEEGAKVEFVQLPAKGGRFQIVALKVLLEEPLKAEEFFKKDEKKTTRSSTGP